MNINHILKTKTILAIAAASVVCFVASYLVAKILLILNNGFGAGDMTAFLYWTSYFVGLLLVPSLLFSIVFRNTRTINRVWIGVLTGGLAGFSWTLLNLWLLGPWFGAWSFNVVYCWVLGGAFGILVLALLGHQPRALP